MGKKLMIDECHRIPTFMRFIVMFDCGCSYFNDSWLSKQEGLHVCPEHNLGRRMHGHQLIAGIRPKSGKLKRHSVKSNLVRNEYELCKL